MTQYLRPISDINAKWTCSTGSNRYALIDEETYSDIDFISGTAGNGYQEVKLVTGQTPGNRLNHIVNFRSRYSTSGSTLTVTLVQGSTTIASSTKTPASSFTNYSFTLTEAQANLITDYSDLRIRFTTNGIVYVSQAYMEVPDGGSKPGLEMGCLF